jgi:regulator of replication initiation timing
MTENLLQKLEEKMLLLISEVEDLRKEIQHLNHENSVLRIERENHAKKLEDLISLLDTVNLTGNTITGSASIAA